MESITHLMRCFTIFHKVRGGGTAYLVKEKRKNFASFTLYITFRVSGTGLGNTTMFYLKYGPVDKNHIPCTVPGILQVLNKNRHTSEECFCG